jgi:3-hydroxymyristoyl/3-hydroxydecanoyl-(acyl carrier protein) dehydratase
VERPPFGARAPPLRFASRLSQPVKARARKKRYGRGLDDTFAGFTLIESSVSAEEARLRLWLPSGSPYLTGHGEAVLPGVAQLALALHAGSLLEGGDLALAGARGVRFRRPLRPESELELLVTRTGAVDELRFEVRTGNAKAASGTLKVTRLLAPRG